MSNRFYLQNLKERPAYWGDLGSRITICGVLLQGTTQPIVLHLPESSANMSDLTPIDIHPTNDEWCEIIRHSDDPEIFEHDETGCLIAIHRKVRYSISGFVQQKIWIADGLKCMYCGRKMGDVQLTVDHFMPLDLGGRNVENNYLSACRKCNKQKGGCHPKEWCTENQLNFEELSSYLQNRKI